VSAFRHDLEEGVLSCPISLLLIQGTASCVQFNSDMPNSLISLTSAVAYFSPTASSIPPFEALFQLSSSQGGPDVDQFHLSDRSQQFQSEFFSMRQLFQMGKANHEWSRERTCSCPKLVIVPEGKSGRLIEEECFRESPLLDVASESTDITDVARSRWLEEAKEYRLIFGGGCAGLAAKFLALSSGIPSTGTNRRCAGVFNDPEIIDS